MIDESYRDDEVHQKVLQFSWSMKTASASGIQIKLDLEHPEVYDGQQYVSIRA